MNFRNIFIGIVSVQLVILLILSFYKKDNQIAYQQLEQISRQLETDAILINDFNEDLTRNIGNFHDNYPKKIANDTLIIYLYKQRKLFNEIEQERAKIASLVYNSDEERKEIDLGKPFFSITTNRLTRPKVTFQNIEMLSDAWNSLKEKRTQLLGNNFFNQKDRNLINENWSNTLDKLVFIKKLDNATSFYQTFRSLDFQNAFVFLDGVKLELALLACANTQAFYEITQQMIYPFDEKELKIATYFPNKSIKKNVPFPFYLDIKTAFRDPDIAIKIDNQPLEMDNGLGIYSRQLLNKSRKTLGLEAIFSNSYDNQIDTVSMGLGF